MFKEFKNKSYKLALITVLAISPLSLQATSSGGIIEGSSESSSAAIEDPSFEKQIVRINVGINLIRINTDILETMPVSADTTWVDEIISPMDYNAVNNLEDVKNDVYYSTVNITNLIQGKYLNIRMSPLEARLYWEASILYKNARNNNPDYKLPSMNQFPDITDTKSYTSFNEDEKVAIINVEATSSNLYNNVEAAVISLLPEDLQESVSSAKAEYDVSKEELDVAKSNIENIKAWLDDDANSDSDERAEKEEELEVSKAFEDEKSLAFDEKQSIYFELLASGAEAIESNFDESKVPLAQKLEHLLDAVDNNAIGALSMFAAAFTGMGRGYGVIDDEVKAMAIAQGLTTLIGNQKEFIIQRATRMGIGTLFAIPNIGIGSYYASAQLNKIGKYQDVVNAVLEAAEVAEEIAEETTKGAAE
ncbi:hypothetical protein GJV85_04430 [Sulfurimonas aquatica]|uniref:Uncharacterized protein n=1 Tax=Sulfurimonas aquatica TaxID=2672570 RepID=A0A975AZE1_9BACT|nr:hypothetical protein [Sulfurimonas aquatica]QSZ41382.1 hypothetical protein GJV85_04430 [Sulfurimonas aquatica]